jgi:hypothetical protein
MSEEATALEDSTPLDAAPPSSGAGVLSASLVVAVVITLPLHLAALRGEASVSSAMVAFAIALSVLLTLGALLTWLVSAIDGDPTSHTGGHDEDGPDHRIVPC